MTDRWTDDERTEKMLLSHTLAMRGSDVHVASLVEFHPVV